MKRLLVLISLVSVFLVYSMRGSLQPAGRPIADTGATDNTSALLRAMVTLQILAPIVDENGNAVVVEEDGQENALNAVSTGLGTVVQTGSGKYLVTHDHYAQLDAGRATVIITDYLGKETLLDIIAFRGSIRYRNNGVLILDAPPGLPEGVATGDGEQVPPGATVQVVYRQAETGTLSVVPAVVETWIDYQGIPSYQVRNLNGEIVRKGNSGGGVFYEGKLVGAIHRTILATEASAAELPGEPSHRSYVSRLSADRMSVLR